MRHSFEDVNRADRPPGLSPRPTARRSTSTFSCNQLPIRNPQMRIPHKSQTVPLTLHRYLFRGM
jgi:hypothetical protein